MSNFLAPATVTAALRALLIEGIAADNAVFGQTGPKVGSFDGGYGASYSQTIH